MAPSRATLAVLSCLLLALRGAASHRTLRAPRRSLARPRARVACVVTDSVATSGDGEPEAQATLAPLPGESDALRQRALRAEDCMLLLRVRRDLEEGELAVQLGKDWSADLSMVSDIDFGGIARRLRRDAATVRTRLSARGAISADVAEQMARRLQSAIAGIEDLAAEYEAFLERQREAYPVPAAAKNETILRAAVEAVEKTVEFPVLTRLAPARRTIAKLNRRRQQLRTTIEAPPRASGRPTEGAHAGGGAAEVPLPSAAELLNATSALWNRLNPARSGEAPRRNPLSEEARALRISRTEIERLQLGIAQLQRQQEARNAALSQDSRRFLLEQMLNAQSSISKMQADIAVKLIAVNLERACAFLEDELREAVDSPPNTNHDQLIRFTATFVRLGRRFSRVRSRVLAGQLEPSDATVTELERDVQDLMLVLGITTPSVDAVEWDLPRTADALKSNVDRMYSGVDFYLRGVRLLLQDTSFSLGLVSRAASGRTLSEREARILQRTARDLLTFIPFVVILIIPLSPPGHVLVFSLIQRIFPDFFPTAFSEDRQQLIDTYERLVKGGEESGAKLSGAAEKLQDDPLAVDRPPRRRATARKVEEAEEAEPR